MTDENLKAWFARNAAQPFAEIVKTADGLEAMYDAIILNYAGGEGNWIIIPEAGLTRERWCELVESAEKYGVSQLTTEERAAYERLLKIVEEEDFVEYGQEENFNLEAFTLLGLFRARAKLTDAPLYDVWNACGYDEDLAVRTEDDVLFCDLNIDEHGYSKGYIPLAETGLLDRAA